MTHSAHFVHYTRIKYLLHSYAETSKRRHEFISCGLRSEKTQYRVSTSALFGARALLPAFLCVGNISNFLQRNSRWWKKQVTFLTKLQQKFYICVSTKRTTNRQKIVMWKYTFSFSIFERIYFNSIVSNIFQ